MEERSLEDIQKDVQEARDWKTKVNRTSKELARDINTVIMYLTVDCQKYLEKGMEAPAKRIRAHTKLLETLGKSFRIQSTKNKNI
jgi:hypothetical protein